MSSSYMPGPPRAAEVPRAEVSGPRTTTQPAMLALAGRFLFSLVFILGGFGHFSQDHISAAAAAGVPFAAIAVPVSGVIALIGGFSILLGFYARAGAWLTIVFLAPVTAFMHNFWVVQDSTMRAMQEAHFMKNVAMIGGALLIAYFGAGPMSLDRKR